MAVVLFENLVIDGIDCLVNCSLCGSYTPYNRTRACLRVPDNPDVLLALNSDSIQYGLIRLLADSCDEVCAIKRHCLSAIDRLTASRCILFTENHLRKSKFAVCEVNRVSKEDELYAIRECCFVLFSICRHFAFASSVNNSDILDTCCSLSHSCCIHCSVTTACDYNVLTEINLFALLTSEEERYCTFPLAVPLDAAVVGLCSTD